LLAKALNVTRNTIYKWSKRKKHFRDRRKKKPKVTLKVELSISALRNTFGWGTERIRNG